MNWLFKAKSLFHLNAPQAQKKDKVSEPGAVAKRRRKRIIWAVIAFLFIAVTSAELLFTGPRANIPIANNLLILFLLNINILLLMAMVVLVGRNLVKLYTDHHGRIFGTRFQTRLVLSFLGLTLIPSTLLFIVASGLITNSIDNWFSRPVEKSLKDSLEVADRLYRQSEQIISEKAKGLAELIGERGMLGQGNMTLLAGSVQHRMEEYGAEAALVMDADMNEIIRLGEVPGGIQLPGKIDGKRLARLKSGDSISETVMVEKDSLVISLVPINEPPGTFAGALMIVDTIDRSLVEKVNAITRTFDEYKQLKLQKFPIKAVYEVTLLLITLVILFAAIWYGVYLARDITVPIRNLAEATQKVTEGDLTVRLEEKSGDEIGFLIRSFNRMTEELETSRSKLESSHKELMETNLELDRRRKYIETVMTKIATGVISIDGKGRVTTCNPAALSILKLNGDEQRGRYYKEVFEPVQLEPIRKMLREMGRQEKDSMEEEIQLVIEGVPKTLLVHASTLRDAMKQFMGVVMVFEDLTDIISAQKTSAWRDIAQHLAHEIKNPLTPIKLNTERLRRNYAQDRKGFDKIFDDSTHMIIQEVGVLSKLVDEFSRFAQLPEADPTMVRLHKIITDVVNLYKDLHPDIIIKTSFDPTIGLVRLDKEQMHRAFRNLLENAIDAVGEQGTVEIRTMQDLDKKRVHIEISDDGPGINVSDHDKVFLPYFSTKKKGTGLGLAIVNRIVADHEGQIRVKDRSPHGTIMAIDLPA
jgi:two-component system nitrogen regulation sensor histidine kinase NtrY